MLSIHKTLIGLAAVAALASASSSRAAEFSFNGNLTYHNDVVHFDFALASDAVDVRIWTDSWLSGLNFDPTAALWVATAGDFSLLAVVDDDDTVAAGQGYYDAGFHLPALAAGQYRLTLAAAINAPSGALLSQGFEYDAQTPIPIGLWNQPSYDPNANDQKGTFWRMHFSNVDQASAVPEPGSWMLMALGIGAWLSRGVTQRERSFA